MLKPGDHHYRAFVGPPQTYDLMSAYQFCLLAELGLREDHKLLDIGCGSLRAGRLFIPYLNPGNYYGVDPEKWLVEEGIKNEVGEDLIRIKTPHFRYVDDWSFTAFNTDFDYLVAQSVFSHASQSQIVSCLRNCNQCMNDKSLLAATFLLGLEDYQGSDWVYPGIVPYRHQTIVNMAEKTGLNCVRIPGFHNNLTWYLMAKPGKQDTLKQYRRRLRKPGSQTLRTKAAKEPRLKWMWGRLPEGIKQPIRNMLQK